MGYALTAVIFLFFCYLFGRSAEYEHYEDIEKREKEFLHLPAVDFGADKLDFEIERAEIIYAGAVVSVDFFKRVYEYFKRVFGGEIRVYSSIIDRSRREALLKLKEKAADADYITDIRFENVYIKSYTHGGIGCAEVLAFGTAVWKRKNDEIPA